MDRGEFVRVTVAQSSGTVAARVYPPGESAPSLTVGIGASGGVPPYPLSWEAEAAGSYMVVLDASLPGMGAEGVRVDVQEHQSAPLRARMRETLRSDPRVGWLQEHALALRSISPDDADFSDLEPLREDLSDVRVVLLGESFQGTDFLVLGRVVRFLHEDLGFDVLALQAGGLYDMFLAWEAMREGVPANDAFARGARDRLAHAEQMQPLIAYVGRVTRTDRPLELAGFDMQFSGTPGELLGSDLQRVLDAHNIGGPLSDSESPERAFLARLASVDHCNVEQSALPESAGRIRFLSSLEGTAERISTAVPGRQGAFWARVLENTAVCARHNFGPQRGRDRAMAENLVWLANEYYKGRKIIAWGQNQNVVRNLGKMTDWAWSTYTMGDEVWQALGEESFVIGTTSFRGHDRHPLFELEELMDAAGIEYGLVNLRSAKAGGTWPGGRFPASVLFGSPVTWWHEHFDALLFIRNPEPRREGESQ